MPKRSKGQIERLRKKRARGAKTGKRFVIHTKSGSIRGVGRDKDTGRTMSKGETYGPTIPKARGDDEGSRQPSPKIPLLPGGKDPTLGERFEEELYRS